MPYGIKNGMKIKNRLVAVDKAGRIVLPKPVREQLHLLPGSELEIHVVPHALTLTLRNTEPALVSKDGIWVHQGDPTGDLVQAVEKMREQRIREAGGI